MSSLWGFKWTLSWLGQWMGRRGPLWRDSVYFQQPAWKLHWKTQVLSISCLHCAPTNMSRTRLGLFQWKTKSGLSWGLHLLVLALSPQIAHIFLVTLVSFGGAGRWILLPSDGVRRPVSSLYAKLSSFPAGGCERGADLLIQPLARTVMSTFPNVLNSLNL